MKVLPFKTPQYLKQSLDLLEFSPGSALLQYVDDLFICSPSSEVDFTTNYAVIEKPLHDLTKGVQLHALDRLRWTPEADKAYTATKTALLSPPTLGLLDPNQPFT